jgi:hypothetical protein
MAVTLDLEIGNPKDAKPVEKKAKKSAEKTRMQNGMFWASNLVGLLCGLMFGLSGFGKVTGAMDPMIETTIAPFYGVPVIAIKVLAFFGHLNGGLCMILGLGTKTFAQLEDTKANLLETLILMDGVGMSTIAFGAVFLHAMRNEAPSPLLLVVPFALLRFGYNGWAIPGEDRERKLFFGFLGFNVVGFLVSVLMHFTIGEA